MIAKHLTVLPMMLCFILFIGCSKAPNYDQLKFYDQTNKKSYNLNKIDPKNFVNKPITLLLNNEAISRYRELIFVDDPPGVLSGLVLVYPNKITVRLQPATFDHIKKFDMLGKWNLNLFAKEKLKKMEFYYDNKLLK